MHNKLNKINNEVEKDIQRNKNSNKKKSVSNNRIHKDNTSGDSLRSYQDNNISNNEDKGLELSIT